MRKITLSILFLSFYFSVYCTTWTITNTGFAFSPAMLTIKQGDTVVFALTAEHNSVEVSMTTWNMNGTTPLPGGWVLPLGGGMVLPEDLTAGTHYYVCQPHASGGMKGIIIVTGTTAVDDKPDAPSFSIYPNPSSGRVQVLMGNTPVSKNYKLEVFDAQGNRVYATSHLNEEYMSEIELSGLAKGLYVVRFYNSQGIHSRKLILQ